MLAVDLPLKYCSNYLALERKRVLEELGEEGKVDPKIEAAYQQAIDYLESCKNQGGQKVKALTEALGTEIRSA